MHFWVGKNRSPNTEPNPNTNPNPNPNWNGCLFEVERNPCRHVHSGSGTAY